MRGKFNSKGFFTVDAFMALFLLTTVVTALLSTYEARMEVADSLGLNMEAKMVCEKIAAAVDAVYVGGPGLSLRFELSRGVRENFVVYFDRDERAIVAENSEMGVSGAVTRAPVVCNNVLDFELWPENLRRTIVVRWVGENIEVGNP